jgi:hypothetical protein
MNNPFQQFISRVFSRQIDNQANRRVALAVRALDDVTDRQVNRDTYPRDRYDYDRAEILRDALDAWRLNPLARRIVELTSQYVVGGGLGIESKHEATHRFLRKWWDHRLNRMSMRSFDLSDELSRTGNLFCVISTDASGMSFVRALPTADILEIETRPNDVEQEIAIWQAVDPAIEEPDTGPNGILGKRWTVYDENTDDGKTPVIVHYSVNRPVGAKWGESDLAPILKWLARYSNWLEDRARLNRYRQAFVYVVKAQFNSQTERLQRQAELNANPPNPGSILVADSSEEWSVLNPNLASFEAAEDGLALKKMIAVGSGNPLHFLAEPESSTRTTAESAGGPTYRHYEQRQQFFLWMLEDLAGIAVNRKAAVSSIVSKNAEVLIKGTDISARDNASLAVAASTITNAFVLLRQAELIDDAELLRMAYRFSGEVVDVEDMLRRGKEAGPLKMPVQPTAPGAAPAKRGGPTDPPGIDIKPIKVDPETGESANA